MAARSHEGQAQFVDGEPEILHLVQSEIGPAGHHPGGESHQMKEVGLGRNRKLNHPIAAEPTTFGHIVAFPDFLPDAGFRIVPSLAGFEKADPPEFHNPSSGASFRFVKVALFVFPSHR
jgi:hypothetical protein